MKIYYQNNDRTQRPAELVIRATMDRFRTTFTLVDNAHSQRHGTKRTEGALCAVEQIIEEDPNKPIRHRARLFKL